MPHPAGVTIRPVTAADLPAVVALRDALNRLELAGTPHAPIVGVTLEQFTAAWGGTLDSPKHCWRLVEAAGRPVGFGLIYLMTPLSTPPGAYIHWTYLDEPYRRRGVGRLLLDHLLEWAKGQGVGRVELQFIEGNGQAAAFWPKVGFRPFARRCVRYLGEK